MPQAIQSFFSKLAQSGKSRASLAKNTDVHAADEPKAPVDSPSSFQNTLEGAMAEAFKRSQKGESAKKAFASEPKRDIRTEKPDGAEPSPDIVKSSIVASEIPQDQWLSETEQVTQDENGQQAPLLASVLPQSPAISPLPLNQPDTLENPSLSLEASVQTDERSNPQKIDTIAMAPIVTSASPQETAIKSTLKTTAHPDTMLSEPTSETDAPARQTTPDDRNAATDALLVSGVSQAAQVTQVYTMGQVVNPLVSDSLPAIQDSVTSVEPSSTVDVKQPILENTSPSLPPLEKQAQSIEFQTLFDNAAAQPAVKEVLQPHTESIQHAHNQMSHSSHEIEEALPQQQPFMDTSLPGNNLENTLALSTVVNANKPSSDATTRPPELTLAETVGLESIVPQALMPPGSTSTKVDTSRPGASSLPNKLDMMAFQNHLTALNGQIEQSVEPLMSRGQKTGLEAANTADTPTAVEPVFTQEEASLDTFDALNQSLDAMPTIQTASATPSQSSLNPVARDNAGGLPSFLSQAQNPVEQVVDGTLYSVKNGHKELILRLNPDNLGEVRINLISRGGNELSARFIASTPESRALLQDQLHTLKASLESQGIQVERMSVMLAGRPESQQHFGSHPQSDEAFQEGHQQQSNTAQQQQTFDQSNPNPFAQMAGQSQHRPSYRQAETQMAPTQANQSSDTLAESGTDRVAAPHQQDHQHGHVSILA